MDRADALLIKAKSLERAMAIDNPEGREWHKVGMFDSYGSESNRVEAWALEGSPVRGYIIWRWADGVAWRYDGNGKRIKVIRPDWDA